MGGGRDMDIEDRDEGELDTGQLEYDRDIRELTQRGLPFPDPAHSVVSDDRLDMAALWRDLTDADRERMGVLALGIVVGGTIAAMSELTAPAASRAGAAHSDICMEELCNAEGGNPEAVERALRGPSWKLPASIGPICRSCGCSECDACIDALGNACTWADAEETLCTHCQNPRPRLSCTDADIPF